MSFNNEDQLNSHHRKQGAASLHDSLPTPDLTLLDQTPTPTVVQLMGEADLPVAQNPFDVIFRKAIGSVNEPQMALLSGPSFSVSTPNTADLLAMIGGAVAANGENETAAKQNVAAMNASATNVKLNSSASGSVSICGVPQKSTLSSVLKADTRRTPKKSFSRQNSASQNEDVKLTELETQQSPASFASVSAVNHNQTGVKPGFATAGDLQAAVGGMRARTITKKRTSLSIKLPGNSATSPMNDVPSVSSSTDESSTQVLTVATQKAPGTQLLVGAGRQTHSEVQLGEAFLAQFDQRDGVQTPTTAEVINTAIEMQIADGVKLSASNSTLSLSHSTSSLGASTNPLAAAVFNDVKPAASSQQRGAHANVNVNSIPSNLAPAKLLPVRPAVPASTAPAPAATVSATVSGNPTLLTTGGQMILLPANLLGAAGTQQSTGPVYIIAQPNALGTTQLIPAAGNTVTWQLPSGAQQTVTAVSMQQPQSQPANTVSNNLLQTTAISNRTPSAKEALKRAINQPKAPGAASDGPTVETKARRIAQGTSLDKAAEVKPVNLAGGNGFVLQHATVDSTTRLTNSASSQLAVVQNGSVTISLPSQPAAFSAVAQGMALASTVPISGASTSAAPASGAGASSEAASPADVELVRRQRFLERNRAAAARCRQRRKHYTETLQGEVNSLKQLAAKQSSQINSLRKQIAHLKLLLLAHKDCPVTEEQSRQGLFSALVPADLDSTPSASTPESTTGGALTDQPSTGAHAAPSTSSVRMDEAESDDDDPDASTGVDLTVDDALQ